MPRDAAASRARAADTTLDSAIVGARAALGREQRADGHFVYELEADATIPAEYVLLEHYLDRIEPELERRIGNYLREIQGADGGWPLFYDGRADLSATVKAYYALKAIGDDPAAPHMVRARELILDLGGAERANVFTRALLALFGQVPWRAVPIMPMELMIAPKWFPINLWRVSYWSRTVIVPLLVLMELKPSARNPRGVGVAELFRRPPESISDWIRGPYRSAWGRFFKGLDWALRRLDPFAPERMRRRHVDKAVGFVRERMNGDDGLGGIYPAIANAVMMFDALGCAWDHPDLATAWSAVRKLLVVQPDRAYCQPCLSPVWDTGLAAHALAETEGADSPAVVQACGWLRERQITNAIGDWAQARPRVPPGGWAFQYVNPQYPDVDDTAVVGMLLHRNGDRAHGAAIARARDWIIGMQCRGGGWGAFDADNDHDYLNHIPFADHGALLDPPTADVTARCVSFLAQIGLPAHHPALARAVEWLRREQEQDGSWFGRWGTNYIYGAWSVLCALNAIGLPHDDAAIRRAAAFVLATQRDDGGWGEGEETYDGAPPGRYTCSTPSHTAWALLGLMAAGEADNPAVARGVEWLVRNQAGDGTWQEQPYNAVGFPRVFYLRYHGYKQYFPLLALARFRNLRVGDRSRVAFGF